MTLKLKVGLQEQLPTRWRHQFLLLQLRRRLWLKPQMTGRSLHEMHLAHVDRVRNLRCATGAINRTTE